MDFRRRLRDKRQRVWLNLARRGNEDAFLQLHRELYPPVASYINRRVQVIEDAEDLTATVFGRFVQKLDVFDSSRGTVMSWILTMARNAVIDHHRIRRPVDSHDPEFVDLLAGQQLDQLRLLVRDEDIRLINNCLLHQPAEIREMFALRFDQDLRIREIAEILNINHDAARQRFARALTNIRQELKTKTITTKGGRICSITD